MNGNWHRGMNKHGFQQLVRAICQTPCRFWAQLTDPTVAEPVHFGSGPHDCALVALHRVVPWIREEEVLNAFNFCSEEWPYGGVTNKEFMIALSHLNINHDYDCLPSQTLGSLLVQRPRRCVALVHGHFVAIAKGKIVGKDANGPWNSSSHVYCHWSLHRSRFLSGRSRSRTSGSTS